MARTLLRPRKAKLPSASEKLVELHEDFARSSVPHQVDREAGIIRRVKVLGRKSPNSHGKAGARSTEYTLEAMRDALARYADCPVNIDHRDRRNPHADRSALDRFGKLVNPVIEADGIYADLLYLKAHPMAERVAEAAERAPDLFGMSHDALGDGHVKDGVFVITSLPHIRSVDLVADPGSVNSLFESKEAMKTTLKQLAESWKPGVRAFLKPLLEDDAYADMPMDAPVADEDPKAARKKHLLDALAAYADSDDLADHDLAKKIMAMLKPEGAADETPEPVEEADEEETDDDKKDKEKKAMESRQLQQEVTALKLCMESKVILPSPQLKAMCLMESVDDMKAFLASLTPAEKPAPQRPRSQGPVVVTESKDAEAEYCKNFTQLTGHAPASSAK